MKRASKGWHREDIKAALRKKYGSLASLSKEWGLASASISNTLKRAVHSVPTERRIAQALGVQPHALWPDRWSPEGSPLPRSDKRHRSSAALTPHRQSESTL